MRRLGPILLLLGAGWLLATNTGCASSGSSTDPYYGRGTTAGDSFPDTYGRYGRHPHGRYGRHGRPGRYGY
jgi:hypothetical protein